MLSPALRDRAPNLVAIVLWSTSFLFVFGWKVTRLADLIFFVSLLLSATLVFRRSEVLDRMVILIIAPIAALTVYAAAITFLHGMVDAQIALRSLRALVNFLGAFALVLLYKAHYREAAVCALFRHLFLLLTAHAALMLAMNQFEPFRETVYGLTHAHDYVNLQENFLKGFRVTGLTYGLALTSVVQSFGILLIPALLSMRAFGRLTYPVLAGGVVLLVVSMMLSGLSGFILLFGFFPLVLVIRLGSLDKRSRPKTVWVLMAVFAAATLPVLAVFYVAPLALVASYKVPEELRIAVLHIYSLKQIILDPLNFYKISHLLEMYFLPEDTATLIFGSSNFGRGAAGYIPSDVGYVRSVFGVGIVGTLLMAAPLIAGIATAWCIRRRAPWLAALTITFLLAGLIMHFKEVALMTRNLWSLQSLLLGACLLLTRNWQLQEQAAHLVTQSAGRSGRDS